MYQKGVIYMNKIITISREFGSGGREFADKGVVIIGKDLDDPVAYNAACLLKKAGYKNPVILKGGMVDWVGRGLPVVKK